jgi:hypothetical protein
MQSARRRFDRSPVNRRCRYTADRIALTTENRQGKAPLTRLFSAAGTLTIAFANESRSHLKTTRPTIPP